MFRGFKDFLMRGNIVDLAVAVVMGAALTALVSSLSEAFIDPLIKLVTGGASVGGRFTINGVVFPYSTFINGVIIFVLTAASVYFVIVMPVKKVQEAIFKKPEEQAPAESEEIVLLRQIRDALIAQGQVSGRESGQYPGPRTPQR